MKTSHFLFDTIIRIYAEKRTTFYVIDGSTTQVRLIFKFESNLIHYSKRRLYAVLRKGVGVIEPVSFKLLPCKGYLSIITLHN